MCTWRKAGIVLLVGIHAFLCGCVVEILRAMVAERLLNSPEPLGVVPEFFLRTLSAPGRFPLYPSCLEIFGIVFVIYLLCSTLTPVKNPWSFYLRSGLFHGIFTTLCVGFAAVFLLTLHHSGKRELLPEYTVSLFGSIIHFLFLFGLAVYLILLIRKWIRNTRPSGANRSADPENKSQ